MDFAQFAGVDYVEVPLAGQLYRVGRLTIREWAYLQAWIKAHSPSPLSSLKSEDLAGLAREDRQAVLNLAFQENKAWPPRIGSAAWFRALDAPGGQAELLRAILAKHQPAITVEQCEVIAATIELIEVITLACHALGADPDPKSPAPVPGAAKPGRPTRAKKRTGSARSPSSSPATGAGHATTSST